MKFAALSFKCSWNMALVYLVEYNKRPCGMMLAIISTPISSQIHSMRSQENALTDSPILLRLGQAFQKLCGALYETASINRQD